MMSQLKESDTMSNPTLSPGVPVPEAPTFVIEAVPIFIFPVASQATAPTPRTRTKRSPQPEYLVHWDVSRKQRPNGRTDTYYRHKELHFLCRSLAEVDMYEKHGIRPKRAKKPKCNKEEIKSHEPLSVMALPWKEDKEAEAEAAYEKIMNMNTSDPSTSTSTAPKVKRERKKKVKKVKDNVNWAGLSELNLLQVPITYVKEFKDYKAVPEV